MSREKVRKRKVQERKGRKGRRRIKGKKKKM